MGDTAHAVYWNHNAAYHDWICRIAMEHRGAVLDVGCGEGLLAYRLAPVSAQVTGIDPDGSAVVRAKRRVRGLHHVTIQETGFLEFDSEPDRYDLVTFVASIHHMNLGAALLRARRLLRSGGELVVVGLSANKTVVDWAVSGFQLPLVRLGNWVHR